MSTFFGQKKKTDNKETYSKNYKSDNSPRRNDSRPFERDNESPRRSSHYDRSESSSRPARSGFGSRDSNYRGGERSADRGGFGQRSNASYDRGGGFGGGRGNGGGSFDRGGRSSSFGRNRSGGRGGFGGGNRRREIKKFNPSDFIKKVEEQTSSPVFVPKHTFATFALNEQVKKNIAHRGYVTPTPIQDEAIPYILESRDIIATANTGTGKTAAFLIPLVSNILAKKIARALIIAPTRELAAQIQDELHYFKDRTPLSSALCIGGSNISFQIQKMRRDPAFVIGTPGRLKDLEKNGYIDFSKYSAIVLDEVDTMLDMGFITDIKYILSKLPEQRHSLFFSATISHAVKGLMNGFLNNPVSVNVQMRQSAENVNQDVIKVEQQDKVEILHGLLIKPEFKKVIIFSRTRRATDKLSYALQDRGFSVVAMHGDKTQGQRKKALELFKGNRVKVLLATDVVARGIDIDDVSHVINFDLPQTYEDYIHRIGRTGRANKIGQALTFID
jgi:superfamily II DNA/RNA helicase